MSSEEKGQKKMLLWDVKHRSPGECKRYLPWPWDHKIKIKPHRLGRILLRYSAKVFLANGAIGRD